MEFLLKSQLVTLGFHFLVLSTAIDKMQLLLRHYIDTLKGVWSPSSVSSFQLLCYDLLSSLYRTPSSTGFILINLAKGILTWSSLEFPTCCNATLESCFTHLCCVFIPIISFATSASSHFTSSHTSFGILSSVHFSNASNCSPITTR